MVNTPTQIGLLASDYFQRAYLVPVEAPNPPLDNLLLDPLLATITQDDNNSILCVVTPKEFCLGAFSMGAYKAPSPNGFPPALFQIFWDIVGKDLVLVARDFFKFGNILK